MKWEYCEHCYIDGHCENQDRGHECENYGKRMKDKCERLQKQLYIAVECMQRYIRGGCYPLMEKKLKEIEELKNDNRILHS